MAYVSEPPVSRSGQDGYPDEEDFFYVALASGISFEVDMGIRYIPHYGTAPISARLLFRKIADGAGHLSDHYDLSHIYAASECAGTGRWRLRRRTSVVESIYGTVDRMPMPGEGDVKIGNHGSTNQRLRLRF